MAKAEYWNQHAMRRVDLFGFIDIVALADGTDRIPPTILAIQATTLGNASTRVKKILEECSDAASSWLFCGGAIEVWGWRKLKVGGWEPRIYEVQLEDFK